LNHFPNPAKEATWFGAKSHHLEIQVERLNHFPNPAKEATWFGAKSHHLEIQVKSARREGLWSVGA
jgi:hypothetical protein